MSEDNENKNFEAVEAEENIQEEPTSPLLILLILLAAPVAGIIMGNWVTRGFCILVTLLIIRNYRRGAARAIAALVCLVATPLLAIPMGRYTHDMFASMLGASGMTNRIISTTICAIVLFVVLKIVTRFTLGASLTLTGTRRLDKSLGGLLGMAQGSIIGFVLIWAFMAMAPLAADALAVEAASGGLASKNSQADGELSMRQRWANRLAALGRSAEDSTVGRIARSISPMKDTGIIAMGRKGAIVLSDPVARERFLKHPAVLKLKDRPSIRNAIEKLSADEQIQKMIAKGRNGEAGGAWALMNSSALQEVLDETDIVSELAPFRDGLREAFDDAYTEIKPEQ